MDRVAARDVEHAGLALVLAHADLLPVAAVVRGVSYASAHDRESTLVVLKRGKTGVQVLPVNGVHLNCG